VQQTVDTAKSTASSAVGAVRQQAPEGVAAAEQVAPPIAAPPATPPRITVPRRAPAAAPRGTPPAPPTPVDTSSIQGVGREIRGYREKLVQPPVEVPRVKAVDDVVALLGDTLRKVAPQVGALLAPVKPLLGDLGELGDVNGFDLRPLVAVVSPGKAQTLGAHNRGALGPPPRRTVPSAAATAGAPAHTFQAASATPPAAEVGGRPVSPPPRTASAPVAGGATALFFSGGTFVPFLGLLVLAALVAPRLMRRLDELPAFVRPAPFLCALERPG
jgi:hypothetical protein